MSRRRIHLVTDDGCTIELTWEKGAKFTIEVDERPAPTDSSAETATPATVSPESPVATPDAGALVEQQRAPDGGGQ